MFYSNKEFYDAVARNEDNFNELAAIRRACMTKKGLSKAKVSKQLAKIKQGVLNRVNFLDVGSNSSNNSYRISLYKIRRPWNVVPALRDFRPPVGDFGVGVEVEYGFVSEPAAKEVMYHVRNWKHVALDREGGFHGVETTFPPILYSKMSKRDKPFRYLDYLAANQHLTVPHAGMVGTHINISAHNGINRERIWQMNNVLAALTSEQYQRYFNRMPYGFINERNENAESSLGYVEMKLFNSTTCSTTLRRYINIGVALVELLTSTTPINEISVVDALEEGYLKPSGHPKQ